MARSRASSMRRTCSGVMGGLFAGGRGGVVGRDVSAMIDGLAVVKREVVLSAR